MLFKYLGSLFYCLSQAGGFLWSATHLLLGHSVRDCDVPRFAKLRCCDSLGTRNGRQVELSAFYDGDLQLVFTADDLL